MSIYRDDLEGYERELFIESETYRNEFLKYDALFEMSQIKYKQMCADAELKVLTEGGTYDDLTYLYQEAAQATDAEQKNVFQKMWQSIMNMLTGIKNFFTGKKDIPEDAVVELPANTPRVIQNIGAFVSSPVGFIKKFYSEHPAAKNMTTVTGAIGGVFALDTVYKKFTKSESETWFNQLSGWVSKLTYPVVQNLNNVWGSLKDIIGKGWGEFSQTVPGSLINFVLGKVQSVWSVVKSGLDKIGSAISNGAQGMVNKFKGPKSDQMQKEADKAAKEAEKLGKNAGNKAEQRKAAQAAKRAENLKMNAANMRNHEDRLSSVQQKAANQQNADGSIGKVANDFANKKKYMLDGSGKRLMQSPIAINDYKPMSDKEIANIPREIRRQFGFESAEDDEVIDASTIREVLGGNYAVHVSESGNYLDIRFVGSDPEDDFIASWFDDNKISVQESVFGSDPEDEDFDNEYLNDLASLLD